MEKEGGGGPLIESVSAGDRQRLHPLSLAEGGKKREKMQYVFPRQVVGNTPSSADS